MPFGLYIDLNSDVKESRLYPSTKLMAACPSKEFRDSFVLEKGSLCQKKVPPLAEWSRKTYNDLRSLVSFSFYEKFIRTTAARF